MSATVTWIGLDELMAALKRLPAELTELAEAIVVEASEGAAAEIKAAYPEGETGNLKQGVRVTRATRGAFSVGRVVRSTARHAYLFEVGTKVRTNKAGQNRGFIPGANIFVPVVERRRRDMYEDLTALIEDAGLDVTGR